MAIYLYEVIVNVIKWKKILLFSGQLIAAAEEPVRHLLALGRR
jgi:hypothetical protein